MLPLQNVSEPRQGGNVKSLNFGVMQLHFLVDFCEQCAPASRLLPVSMHTEIEGCVC